MRHRKAGRKLGMNQPHRKAMFRNMVTSLMLHGRIHTTEARAKELRRFAERVITIAKRAPTKAAVEDMSGDEAMRGRSARVHAIRRARRWVNNDEAMSRLFEEHATNNADRPGGYTRVVKAGFRAGDNAPMAVVEIVSEGALVAGVDTDEPADDAAE